VKELIIMSDKIKGTLVILTLNEIKGLESVFPKIPRNRIAEVFAVDGGSTDGTLEYYKKKSVRVMRQHSKGRGEAFRIAMRYAKYDNVIFFSPDGNENPDDIIRLFSLLDKNYDMVIASRFMKGAKSDEDNQIIKLRKFGNKMFTLFANILFHGRLTDSINGFRGIKRSAFKAINPNAKGFGIEFQVSIRAMKQKLKITEIATKEHERIGGKSTASTFKTGTYFIQILFDEYFKK